MNHYAVENLFGIEGLNIAWYGIIITFGMILGFMLALRRCKKTGVEGPVKSYAQNCLQAPAE